MNLKYIILVLHFTLSFSAYSMDYDQQLTQAAEEGNIALVQELILTNRTNINAKSSGLTALHLAARGGHSEVVQWLLTNGADINCCNDAGETPLHWAQASGNFRKTLEILLNNGADVNAQDKRGYTPLNHAALRNDGNYVKELVNKGAKTDIKNNKGKTPLHIAAELGNTEMVEFLVNKDATNLYADDNEEKTPVQRAIEQEEVQVIEYLLSTNRDWPFDYLYNKRGVVKPGVIKAQQNQATLNNAVTNNDLKAVATLLNVPLHYGRWPARRLGVYCNTQAKEFIARKRKELFQAIAQDDVDQVKTFLKQGFSFNTCDKEGNTLLHKAIASGSINVTKLLAYLLCKAGLLNKYTSKRNKAGLVPLMLTKDTKISALCLEIFAALILEIEKQSEHE